jgi:hypothetical protein
MLNVFMHEGDFCIVETQSLQCHHHIRCKRNVLIKMITFASSVSSHIYAGLHLLEWMCRLRLVGAQQCSVNEKDDFHLVGAQSCVCRSSSS